MTIHIIYDVYTSEDLKWDAPERRISNQHWNPTLAEIKCPILFLQGSDSSADLKCALRARPISNLHWYKRIV